jgi:predicted O-methyltransferase YrrM
MVQQFTVDFTTDHVGMWLQMLKRFCGRPKIHGVEIGCFEGRSSVWFLENILQHKTSRLTCIDPIFPLAFKNNLAPFSNRVHCMRQKSQVALRNQMFKFNSIHFVYVDGNHSSPSVLEDAILAFPLLVRGGLLIFDDYRWRSNTPNKPQSMPRLAIDAFTSIYQDRLRVRHKNWQVVVERVL